METYQNNAGGLDFLVAGVTEQTLLVIINNTISDEYVTVELYFLEGDLHNISFNRDVCLMNTKKLKDYMNLPGNTVCHAALVDFMANEINFSFL